jgi:putative flippase GtrA
MELLQLFGMVVLQNASFTLVSRARNSNSYLYHALASVLSNGIWLLVIRHLVLNLDKPAYMVTYVIAAVAGSVLMHCVAQRFFEKKKGVSA